MAHKVHPKIHRIKSVEDWTARGFYGKDFPRFLEEDFVIRQFLEKRLKDAGLGEIFIERFPGKITVTIEALRPGIIIGRGGKGIEHLVREIEKQIKEVREKHGSSQTTGKKDELKLEIKEIRNPWVSAILVARWIAAQLEKRLPFRRCMKQAIEKVMANKEVQGVRVEVAGRLDGIEIARREWLQKGKLPRQTIRADIDYAQAEAYCTYGVIGIKVWIYKGEKID
jgi:small subunit ribosomal protein S3